MVSCRSAAGAASAGKLKDDIPDRGGDGGVRRRSTKPNVRFRGAPDIEEHRILLSESAARQAAAHPAEALLLCESCRYRPGA